ncbi:hypothetical protein UNPF46_30090 [Bradyrhizobium sp. UNPF46]|uniref:DUF2889 domain-containing protein n=1 Tax=Bradyrhizobium sp. UNPF46 TaxID=1141168 RepID=UPI001153FF68|nr:DUF2889 domain-containing protein [Bradyrhizobium sp. UNPF46]TQF27580.1 hypothetical protein UNPF46_30090 [Bradyrhizobium sp. UNPF46]
MPLKKPVSRSFIHRRNVDMQVFRRDDGLYDVEGHIVDEKPFESTAPFGKTTPAHHAIHEMWIRLTIDKEFLVHDVSAATDAGPYQDCFGAPSSLSVLIGTRIGGGWNREVRDKLGGTKSCTHLMEMLTPLATAAYQAMWSEMQDQAEAVDRDGRPRLLNACWAMSSDKELTSRRWPEHYTGRQS